MIHFLRFIDLNTTFFKWSSWDKGDKIVVDSHLITMGGLSRLSYTGHSKVHNLIRTTRPIPKNSTSFYFEAKILDSGSNELIAIGITEYDSRSRSGVFPGWSKYSTLGIGYHGDDGGIFYKRSSRKTDSGEPFTTGDVVGCLVYHTKIEIFGNIGPLTFVRFTKNGEEINFSRLVKDFEYTDYYPTIGMASPGSSVEVNFGEHPFLYHEKGENSKYIHKRINMKLII